MNTADLEKHIAEEHNRSPFSQYLKEIVYGGIDGIITTFAVVAGFSGAQLSSGITTIPLLSVLLFGLANLFADAASMGLGSFLSVRADQDLYTKESESERQEIRNNTEFEKAETLAILKKKGFSSQDAQKLTTLLMKNEDYWVDFMMRDELEMQNPYTENPTLTGFATFASFIIFGAIPLLPYIFLRHSPASLFTLSIVCTLSALILLGIFRWRITRQHIIRSLFETVFVGVVSATVAYTVGTFFKV